MAVADLFWLKRIRKVVAAILILSFTSLQIGFAQEYQTLSVSSPQPEKQIGGTQTPEAVEYSEPTPQDFNSIDFLQGDSPLSPPTIEVEGEEAGVQEVIISEE